MLLSMQHPHDFGREGSRLRVNQLLASLSEVEYQRLAPHLKSVFFSSKTILYKPNEPIREVYFPLQGIITLISTTEAGLIAGIATVGNEGMVGISAFLGGKFLASQTVVQIDCVAMQLAANILKREFNRGGELQKLLLLYTQALFTQVSQNVICSCQHTLEQRLARLLLSFSDRLQQNRLLLTQEAIADLLGVRRPSLSVVASNFQRRGIIYYNRGRITIQNRKLLAETACECDRLIRSEYFRLLGFDIVENS